MKNNSKGGMKKNARKSVSLALLLVVRGAKEKKEQGGVGTRKEGSERDVGQLSKERGSE